LTSIWCHHEKRRKKTVKVPSRAYPLIEHGNFFYT
jgi:hypothetical protein